MTNALVRFGLIAACLNAAPAAAVTELTATGFTMFSSQVGSTAVVRFNGVVNGVKQDDLSADIAFTLTGVRNFGRQWNFSVNIINTSGTAFTSASIGLFGFSTDNRNVGGSQFKPLMGIATQPGLFDTGQFNNDVGFTTPDLPTAQQVCFKTGGTLGECGTGGISGVAQASSTGQAFSLNFATPQGSIVLQNFVLRFFNVNGVASGGPGGPAVPVTGDDISAPGIVVPEPSSWAMLIAGFGLIGAMQRRRRQIAA